MTEKFKKTPISSIVDLSGRNPFITMNEQSSLAEVVETHLKNLHRIAITDEEGDIIGVISQWTIANYLATVPTDDKKWIPTLREPVSKIEFTKEVIASGKNESALDCFLKMYKEKISSLAILNEDGVLWGNLSLSDLKGFQLFLNDFNDLLQPVSQFLSIVRKKQGRTENFVVSATPATPVCDIVKKFNEEVVHRVFIVDEAFHPIGVFSLTDLMEKLIVDTHTISTFAKLGTQTSF